MRKLAIAGLGLLFASGMVGLASAADAPEKTLTGYLTDTFCYSTMGAHGASHKQCAIECARKGIPVALRDKSGNITVLMPNKDKQALPDDVIAKMEEEVTVTGHAYSTGGVNFMTVDSVK